MPNVQKLKDILTEELLYGESGADSLKELCEDCQEDNKERYAQLMKCIFKTSLIQSFQEDYAKIEWKAIYTINVDDVIEKAYEKADKELCCIYTKESVNYKNTATKYFKLHGDAVNNAKDITFSVTDYVINVATSNDYRFENLTAALKTENFIFIGTSLTDEWDFDIKCQQSDIYKVDNKAYFVLPEYNDRIIKRIKRRFSNPCFIQETAESFILKIQQYISQIPPQNQFDKCEKYEMRRIEKKNYEVASYLSPNLFMGVEPTWEDIFSNHDVIWEKTKYEIEELKKGFSKSCILIIGKPISGKTTMLYRLGASLCETCPVLEYTGNNIFDDLQTYIKQTYRQEEMIILVDDANWFLSRINNILALLVDTNIKLIVTIREKEYLKRQYLFDEQLEENIYKISSINSLNKDDIGLYLDKLNEKSFLGIYSKTYNESRDKAIAKVTEELKKGHEDPLLKLAFKMRFKNEKFDSRITSISNDIINSKNYNLKRFAVLLYFLDVIGDTGLKLSLFLDMYHMTQEELTEFVFEIQDLLISNVNRKVWEKSCYNKIIIHSRLSKILEKTIIGIDNEELEEIVLDLFRRLDGVSHFKSRQRNSYQNYVLYTLLRSQNLSEIFHSKHGKVEWQYVNNIYDNLHDYLGDYHLYWLHRGISEIKMKDYSAATLHLEQARVTREGYSFEIEHSFALLYYDQATFSAQMSWNERISILNEALKIIRLQIDNKENDAFSIHSFIVKTIQFYDKNGESVPPELMKEMLEYYDKARRRFNLSQSQIRRNMLICIYRYLKMHDGQYLYNLSVTQEELQYITRRIGNEEIDYNILDKI